MVCLAEDWRKFGVVELYGLLVHEAVHIWQQYCDFYGETTPGREQEAYAVQAVFQELAFELDRRRDV